MDVPTNPQTDWELQEFYPFSIFFFRQELGFTSIIFINTYLLVVAFI